MAGRGRTYPNLRARILQVPKAERRFDLLVITHIDADHIEGVVRLLQDAEALGCIFDRIWFNGRDQLDQVPDPAGQPLGRAAGRTARHAGSPTTNIALARRSGPRLARPAGRHRPGGWRLAGRRSGSRRLPTDATFTGPRPPAVVEGRLAQGTERGRPHVWRHGGAASATRSLTPSAAAWRRARRRGRPRRRRRPGKAHEPEAGELDDALGAAGEAGAAFGSDDSEANGSSIALLLEYPSEQPTVRLLLAGDAWASVLEASIRRLPEASGSGRLALSGFKLPHHGSVRNVHAALLACLDSARYLVSTSGAVFGHPNARAVDLVLAEHRGTSPAQLLFNYRSATTEPWAAPERQHAEGFVAVYPPAAPRRPCWRSER